MLKLSSFGQERKSSGKLKMNPENSQVSFLARYENVCIIGDLIIKKKKKLNNIFNLSLNLISQSLL